MSAHKLSEPRLCLGLRAASDVIRSRRSIILILVLLPVSLIATAGSLNYNGFCISQRSFLPDEEFLRSAIKHTIRFDGPVSIGYVDRREQFAKSIRYIDEADFRAQNPNCCEIMTKPPLEYPSIDAIDRLLGKASKIISVTYFQRYLNQANSISTKTRIVYVTVGNCGAVLNIGR